MAELATLNGLMKATQTEVELPPAAAALLSRSTVTIRRIAGSTFRALFPLIPAAILDGIPADLAPVERQAEVRARELRWIEEAPSVERVRYRVDLEQVKFRALARCLVEPRMTEEEVERLGDDIWPVYVRLLEFSGLLDAPAAAEEAAASEPAAS